MSMPAALDRFYSRDEVLAFPDDGNRYELVYGELLVSPSPDVVHQLVLGRVLARLFTYAERHGVGRVFLSPADLSWGRDDVIVQPDVFVVAPESARSPRWEAMFDFHLFVEILSPSTARHDRFTKRRLYQDMQVPLYWIIDIENRRAEVWTPSATNPAYEVSTLVWHPDGAQDPFTVSLDELLAP
jgi:Uma2 family endonuclease